MITSRVSTPSCESNSDQDETHSPIRQEVLQELTNFPPVADENEQIDLKILNKFEICGCSSSPAHSHAKIN